MARQTTPTNVYGSIFLMPREPASRIVHDEDPTGSLPLFAKLLEEVVFLGSTVLASKGGGPSSPRLFPATSLVAPPAATKSKCWGCCGQQHYPHDHKDQQFLLHYALLLSSKAGLVSPALLPNATALTTSPTKRIGPKSDSLPVQIFQSIRFLLFVHLR